MEYLNTRVANDVLWWHESEGFAFDCNRLQSEFLDKYFEKTKFKSFIRSLNRWGFRRTFYVELPRTIYTFSHPLFKRGEPELARKMKMVSYSRQQQSEMEDFNRRWQAREANKPSDILTIQGIKSHEKSEVTQTTHFTALAPVSAAAMSQLVGGALTEHRVLPHPAQPAGLASQNDSVLRQLLQLKTQPLAVGAASTSALLPLQLLQQHQLQQQLVQQLEQQTIAQQILMQSMLQHLTSPQSRRQQQVTQQQQTMSSSTKAAPQQLIEAVLAQQHHNFDSLTEQQQQKER